MQVQPILQPFLNYARHAAFLPFFCPLVGALWQLKTGIGEAPNTGNESQPEASAQSVARANYRPVFQWLTWVLSQ